jgi:hypothetical protein
LDLRDSRRANFTKLYVPIEKGNSEKSRFEAIRPDIRKIFPKHQIK